MDRITFVMDDDVKKVVKAYQIKKIKESNRAYSFSRCINDLLRGKQ